jgi:hypothetical protein
MPSIQGRELQHALVRLNASCAATGAPGFEFKFFKTLKYKSGAKKEAVRDKSGQQVAYVIRQEETEGSLTTLLTEWLRFRAWLRQQAALLAATMQVPVGVGQVEFELTVTYGQTLSTLATDRLATAMVQEDGRDSSDNQDPLNAEIPLFILAITDADGSNAFVGYGA